MSKTMNKRDWVEEAFERDREISIELVKEWAQRVLNEYEEPVRAGTPKGDPIGLSRKKYNAALLMTLKHQVLPLREVAEITNVSYGLVRVWRTESVFKKVLSEARKELADTLFNTLNNVIFEIQDLKYAGSEFEGYHERIKSWKGEIIRELYPGGEDKKLVPYFRLSVGKMNKEEEMLFTFRFISHTLKFLHRDVIDIVIGRAAKGYNHPEGYAEELSWFFLKCFTDVKDLKALRDFWKNPEMLDFQKDLFSKRLDLIIDMALSEKNKKKELSKSVEELKESIFGFLDILAV